MDDPRERAADVKHAAYRVMGELATQVRDYAGSADSPQYQRLVARLTLATSALTTPMASIGTCTQDGTDLFFQGDQSGLYVCCVNNHCWPVT